MALTSGQFSTGSDGVIYFSDEAENLDLNNFGTLRGKKISFMGGADIVTVFNSASPSGWDNYLNGNLGIDTFRPVMGSRTRDYVRGGKEADVIDFSLASAGGDYLLGDFGDDYVASGSNDIGWNIIRGGRGNDNLRGGNSKDAIIGDLGKDYMTDGAGDDIYVLRIDDVISGGIIESNAPTNSSDCDIVADYDAGFDRIVIPGIASWDDLKLENSGKDTLISTTNGKGITGSARRYIGRILGVSAATLEANTKTGMGLIFGDKADRFYAGIDNPDGFLANADMPSTLLLA